jgi:acyl-CoA reductase-like NAD-dependent aldehyde dehydrogenase
VKLELGNSTPAIVCADAPAGTATKLAANAFSYAGQSCISVQRIFVMNDAWDAFVEEFVPAVEALNVGDPSDAQTDVGPLISEHDRKRVLEWVGESSGEVLTGGEVADDGVIRPTVIASPAAEDKVQCEEVFGPVVTLTAVSSIDEAIELANATRYGLQAAIFSADLQTCLRAARELEFGGVTVNEAPTFVREHQGRPRVGRARDDRRASRGFAAVARGHEGRMAGSLGLGLALLVIGLLGLLFFPWGGVVLVVVGLVIIVLFLFGLGRRAGEPRA